MNQVTLIGRATRDPELRCTKGGRALCFFTLAVDKGVRDRDGKNQANFIPVKIWGKLGENTVDHVVKGSMIALTGRIEDSIYIGKDGCKKYTVEVLAETVKFLDFKRGNNDKEGEGQDEHSEGDEDFTPVEGEEVPF